MILFSGTGTTLPLTSVPSTVTTTTRTTGTTTSVSASPAPSLPAMDFAAKPDASREATEPGVYVSFPNNERPVLLATLANRAGLFLAFSIFPF